MNKLKLCQILGIISFISGALCLIWCYIYGHICLWFVPSSWLVVAIMSGYYLGLSQIIFYFCKRYEVKIGGRE